MANLKGYNFYNDENEVQATFVLKTLTLFLYEKIPEREVIEMRNYLEDCGFEVHHIVRNY